MEMRDKTNKLTIAMQEARLPDRLTTSMLSSGCSVLCR